MNESGIGVLLADAFDERHAKAAITHYQEAVRSLQNRDWEKAILKAGKFIEAALKALARHTAVPMGAGRAFKADAVMRGLEQLGQGTFDDAIRLTIPRACRFVYDIASNNGARHDPQEIDPNEMDATAILSTCSWILAELLRYSQKGKMTHAQVIGHVAGLVQRRYPVVETVDGRTYVHLRGKSAREVAVVLLHQSHPTRITRDELARAVARHGFSLHNAQVAVGRLTGIVDDDGKGALKLLAPGLREAEGLLSRP